MKLDKFDREILRVMQKDATISMADLSQKVGLTHTPCWRRVKKMEAEGLIRFLHHPSGFFLGQTELGVRQERSQTGDAGSG